MAYPVPSTTDTVIGVAVESLATVAEVALVTVSIPHLSRRTKRRASAFKDAVQMSLPDEALTEVLQDASRLEVHLYHRMVDGIRRLDRSSPGWRKLQSYASVYHTRKVLMSNLVDAADSRRVFEKQHNTTAIASIDRSRLYIMAKIALCERQLTTMYAAAGSIFGE